MSNLNLDDLKVTEDLADVITVTLDDNSGLGGPMGSERVRKLKDWSFAKPTMAFQFAEILLERIAPASTAKSSVERLRREFHQNRGQAGIDLGAYGVTVRRETFKIVTGFTYKRSIEVEETVTV